MPSKRLHEFTFFKSYFCITFETNALKKTTSSQALSPVGSRTIIVPQFLPSIFSEYRIYIHQRSTVSAMLLHYYRILTLSYDTITPTPTADGCLMTFLTSRRRKNFVLVPPGRVLRVSLRLVQHQSTRPLLFVHILTRGDP